MSQLEKSTCALKFEEHEFVEFFGMVSPLEEDACSYTRSNKPAPKRIAYIPH